MAPLERLKRYAFGGGLSLLALIFGAYLVYDRVWLAIGTGATEERAGVATRADDPIWFWVSVGMNGFFGSMIVLFGLWGLWLTFRVSPRSGR